MLPRNMTTLLVRKLEAFTELGGDDHAALAELTAPIRAVEGRQDLVREGDTPGDLKLILGGFACRYRLMPDGRRQILSFMIPGDFSDLHLMPPRSIDYGVATISPCEVADVSRESLAALFERPGLEQALRICRFSEEAIVREWLVNVGRRSAAERVAHLLCEFFVRLRVIGQVTNGRTRFPVTQGDIADSTSLSVVHVNRILQDMRRVGLLTLGNRELTIHDFGRLARIGGFSAAYLQLNDDFSGAANEPRRPGPDLRPQA